MVSKEERVERMLFKIGNVWRGKRPVVMLWAWTWWSWEMDLHCFITCKVRIDHVTLCVGNS